MFERYRAKVSDLRDPPVRAAPPREFAYVSHQDNLEWLAYHDGYRAAERAAKRRASSSGVDNHG
jgi:hypothetical protein